jgi:hypothetical protein
MRMNIKLIGEDKIMLSTIGENKSYFLFFFDKKRSGCGFCLSNLEDLAKLRKKYLGVHRIEVQKNESNP